RAADLGVELDPIAFGRRVGAPCHQNTAPVPAPKMVKRAEVELKAIARPNRIDMPRFMTEPSWPKAMERPNTTQHTTPIATATGPVRSVCTVVRILSHGIVPVVVGAAAGLEMAR